MDARVIFDITRKPFDWGPIWSCLGGFVFGCVIVLINKRTRLRHWISQYWGYFMIVCAILTAGWEFAHWFVVRRELSRALAGPGHEVVRGVVRDLRPMPKNGGSAESFSVADRFFSYSDDWRLKPTLCFNQTLTHGGPIQNGLPLQVTFVDNCILRIEVLDQKPADSQEPTHK
jgi:hypothetical protein